MKNSDQPAFPPSSEWHGHFEESGLTKREYFAAMAMQGLLSNPRVTDNMEFSRIVFDATYYADQLLKQLEQ